MAISAPIPGKAEPGVVGAIVGSLPGTGNNTDSGPSAHGLDEQIAPLRIPALVLGALLMCTGVVALVLLPAWLRDYGGWLVIAAYLQYMGIGATLAVWGLRMTRKVSTAGTNPAQRTEPRRAAR
ncbi:hypothetical protein [Nocardia barduliensis]|uniref:hypothetical protein n=1 Tax=Nocardia barduliensis TaxID=2736643 RepID=UPI001572EAF5|nr:hypothetical protein [Nocardia barduliensis]